MTGSHQLDLYAAYDSVMGNVHNGPPCEPYINGGKCAYLECVDGSVLDCGGFHDGVERQRRLDLKHPPRKNPPKKKKPNTQWAQRQKLNTSYHQGEDPNTLVEVKHEKGDWHRAYHQPQMLNHASTLVPEGGWDTAHLLKVQQTTKRTGPSNVTTTLVSSRLKPVVDDDTTPDRETSPSSPPAKEKFEATAGVQTSSCLFIPENVNYDQSTDDIVKNTTNFPSLPAIKPQVNVTGPKVLKIVTTPTPSAQGCKSARGNGLKQKKTATPASTRDSTKVCAPATLEKKQDVKTAVPSTPTPSDKRSKDINGRLSRNKKVYTPASSDVSGTTTPENEEVILTPNASPESVKSEGLTTTKTDASLPSLSYASIASTVNRPSTRDTYAPAPKANAILEHPAWDTYKEFTYEAARRASASVFSDAPSTASTWRTSVEASARQEKPNSKAPMKHNKNIPLMSSPIVPSSQPTPKILAKNGTSQNSTGGSTATIIANARIKPNAAPVTSEKPASPQSWDVDHFTVWVKQNCSPRDQKSYLANYERAKNFAKVVKSELDKIPTQKKGESFHQFSLLPGELRNKIMNIAINDTPSNTVRLRLVQDSYDTTTGLLINARFINLNSAPSLLQVNQETRSLAMAQYQDFFTTNANPKSHIFFNPKKDKVFFHTRGHTEFAYFGLMMRKCDRINIHHLYVPFRDYALNKEKFPMLMALHFNYVKNLELVVGDLAKHEQYWKTDRYSHLGAEITKINRSKRGAHTRWKPEVDFMNQQVTGPDEQPRGKQVCRYYEPKVSMAIIDPLECAMLGIQDLFW